MTNILDAILSENVLRTFLREQIPEHGKRLGRGLSGDVHEMIDNSFQCIKIQHLRYEILDQLITFPSLEERHLYARHEGNVSVREPALLEALIMAHVRSPIIPILHDFGIVFDGETYKTFLVMDKMEGMQYSQFLTMYSQRGEEGRHHRRLYLKMWLDLFQEMNSLHRQYGFIHGDLNRFNMIVSGENFHIRLIDFGTAMVQINGLCFTPWHRFGKHGLDHTSATQGEDIARVIMHAPIPEWFGGSDDEFKAMLEQCYIRHGRVEAVAAGLSLDRTIHAISQLL